MQHLLGTFHSQSEAGPTKYPTWRAPDSPVPRRTLPGAFTSEQKPRVEVDGVKPPLSGPRPVKAELFAPATDLLPHGPSIPRENSGFCEQRRTPKLTLGVDLFSKKNKCKCSVLCQKLKSAGSQLLGCSARSWSSSSQGMPARDALLVSHPGTLGVPSAHPKHPSPQLHSWARNPP